MFIRYNLPAIVWSVIILVLTLSPGVYIPQEFDWKLIREDLLAHFFVFAVLVFLMMQGFTRQHTNASLRSNASVYAVVIAVVYGGVLEVIQGFIPERSFDYFDMVANAVGSFSGWGAFTLMSKMLKGKNNR